MDVISADGDVPRVAGPFFARRHGGEPWSVVVADEGQV